MQPTLFYHYLVSHVRIFRERESWWNWNKMFECTPNTFVFLYQVQYIWAYSKMHLSFNFEVELYILEVKVSAVVSFFSGDWLKSALWSIHIHAHRQNHWINQSIHDGQLRMFFSLKPSLSIGKSSLKISACCSSPFWRS